MPSEHTQTLLANARQSTKNEQVARRKAQRERLQAFWGDCYDLLETFARECIPDYYADGGSDSDTALLSVRKKLYRCKAQTREGFLAWAVRQLAKEPHFHLVADAVTKFDLDISDWIANAAMRLSRYADFPEHFKDGPLYRLNMGESDGVPIVLTIPEQHWEFVRKLWPISLKEKPDGGFYVAKKIGSVTVPVHRLILNCGPGDTVQSTSGNLLDWSSLYVRPFNRSRIYEGRRMGWNKDADRPNTISEEFNARMKPLPVVQTEDGEIDTMTNVGGWTDQADSTGRREPMVSSYREKVYPNQDLGTRSGCFGKIVDAGTYKAPKPDELEGVGLDQFVKSRRPRQSADQQKAAQALTALGWD
jgi:hypothetical protein